MIRVSGSNSLKICKQLCSFLPEAAESHRIYYGQLSKASTEVDEVLVSFFEEGRSFTGEQTCEISCHGSPVVAQEILDSLIESGARVAEPGEFTFRAFMSGRIDLIQAEGVLDIIESESRRGSKLALRQLKGGLSKRLEEIEGGLIKVLAHLEANIDFASEDIVIEANDSLANKLFSLTQQVEELLSTYRLGKAIHDGVDIAIVGSPNVGKSSLLNALTKEDKAIVTDVAGTTRDIVEGTYYFNGVGFNLFDTAGLRQSSDVVESMGIERSKKKSSEVDLNLLVLDVVQISDEDRHFVSELGLKPENCLVVLNKVDRVPEPVVPDWFSEAFNNFEVLKVSAASGNGLDDLKEFISNRFGLKSEYGNQAVLTNSRHLEALIAGHASLLKAHELLKQNESPDIIAFDLMEGLLHLQRLLGKKFDDEVLDRVFKEFCLGK